jgi:hypothetical protein
MVDNRKEVAGTGTEIAKEEKLCGVCAANATQSVVQSKTTVFVVPRMKIERETPEFEGKESRRKRAA